MNPLPIAVATTKKRNKADQGIGYRTEATGIPGDTGTLT